VTATAYTVCGVVLAGCAAWALGDRISTAITRARWAWRCRGKPVREDGEMLTFEETRILGNLAAGRDVRAPT
jgi:hypothetical protein